MVIDRNKLVAGLFEQYRSELYRFLGNRLRSTDFEDLVQETYLKLLQSAHVELAENPRAYMFRTASNLLIDHSRYQKVRNRFSAGECDLESQPSESPEPDEIVHNAHLFERFQQALNELPPLCQDIFLLNWFDGVPNSEIAARLGISKRTVERNINKAIDHCFNSLNNHPL